jgi:hypothetical protein
LKQFFRIRFQPFLFPCALQRVLGPCSLIRTWISISRDSLHKPFFLGEFNVNSSNEKGTRSQWWSAIYNELEKDGAGGSAFWWFFDRPYDNANYGVTAAAPELSIFTAHGKRMAAKTGTVRAIGASLAAMREKGASARLKATFVSGKIMTVILNGGRGKEFFNVTGSRLKKLRPNCIVIEKE